MGESKRQTVKKNHNRPTADKKGLYCGLQKSYYRPKKQLPEVTNKLF